jgi:hypothetical protein
LATHSNLFLDKKITTNNYQISSDENSIHLKQIATNSELVTTSFNLLGGSPADIFFPTNILLVEGRSDKIFLEKLVSLLWPNSSLSVHFAEGVTKMDAAIPAIEQMLKSLSYMSIYSDKLCVLLDKDGVAESTVSAWRNYLGDSDCSRVVQLDKNGIEYYYPRELLKTTLSANEDIDDEQIRKFNDECRAAGREDHGNLGGTLISKVDLAQKVADKFTTNEIEMLDGSLLAAVQRLHDLAFVE